MKDYYATLNIKRDGTPQEIERAYRRLAQVLHPDKGGDIDAFNDVKEAYDVLSDPERRAAYDAGGSGAPDPFNVPQMLAELCLLTARIDAGDVIAGMRLHLANEKLRAVNAIKGHEDEAARLEHMAARVKRTDDGENILSGALLNAATKSRASIIEIAKASARLDKMLAALDDYRYEAPATLAPLMGLLGYGAQTNPVGYPFV